MSKKQFFYTQEIIGPTVLFGKHYWWLKDVDGTIWLAKDKDGAPSLDE